MNELENENLGMVAHNYNPRAKQNPWGQWLASLIGEPQVSGRDLSQSRLLKNGTADLQPPHIHVHMHTHRQKKIKII